MENEGLPQKTAHWNRTVIPERVKERAHTRWVPDLDCWRSTYSTASHGYAQVGWSSSEERRVVLAHRASWEHVNGPMPHGKTLDHVCKNKQCVNPAHLRVLDNYENARRTSGRDWPIGECVNGHSNKHLKTFSDGRTHCGICVSEIWKAKPAGAGKPRVAKPPKEPAKPRTHCRNGHAKNDENTYFRPSGARECLPCKVEYAKKWKPAA